MNLSDEILNENGIENVLATCAIIVSIISFITSLYFSKKARQHNIKSVLPIPYFDRSDFENQIHLKILNKGTGPLIIKEIVAKLKDSTLGQIVDVIPNPPEGYFFNNYSRFTKKETRTVPPNMHNDIIICKFDLDSKTDLKYRDELREFLKEITIHCSYTDIYNSKFDDYIVDCEWYGRHKSNADKKQTV